MSATLSLVIVGVSARCDDFPTIVNNEADTNATPMPAKVAAGSMQLPKGFRVDVFAAEPDVQNPIAMAWDDRGRMWVAENYTYSDRKQHFDLSMRDRVLILEDADGNGVADNRTVFTDHVQMLTSVEVGSGGVYLMCPPKLLFIPDADGDDRPDGPAEVLLDGFTVADSNYHNFANGLRWGPDGWLYGRCGHSCPGKIGVPGTPVDQRLPIEGGIWRYHPQHKTVEVLVHGTVNPWGHDWDENGELFFINTVIGHLWHMIPGAQFKESFGDSANPFVYERLDHIADHYHYDRSGSWTKSRDGAANQFGGGHAHIGMMIYQHDRWPEQYRNKLFTLNMHGQRANIEKLTRQGAGYVGSHQPDFMLVSDPFFRGIEITTGPDGNVYVLDWSDTGECHDHTGVHRTSGRIYKVSYGPDKPTGRVFSKPACLSGEGKLPTLWRNYQAGETTTSELLALLSDSDEHVRVWAIRLLTDRWPMDTLMGPLPNVTYPEASNVHDRLFELANEDESGLVLMAIASTLQRMPLSLRAALAKRLVTRSEFADDRDFPSIVWFGLTALAASENDDDLLGLVDVAKSCSFPSTLQWISRAIAQTSDKEPAALNALVSAAASFEPERQREVLRGLSKGFKGWQNAPEPESWKQLANGVAAQQEQDIVRELNLLFGDGLALDELKRIATSGDQPLKTRIAALETLINAKPDDLKSLCESLLRQRELNAVAARGLSQFDDREVGKTLAKMYRRFHTSDRPAVIEILVSRKSFAFELLERLDVNDGIPASDLNAFHARQILNYGDEELSEALTQSWGALRDSPEERRQLITQLKSRLTPEHLAGANLAVGRKLFQKTCSQCHQLFGEGENIGPGLTGAQRSSLDYLLENILDPSAVVGKDHRMSIVLLDDGRVFNGLIISENDRTMEIQTQTRKERLAVDEIEQVKKTTLSPMPDGLLNQLSDEEVRDLIGYLMSPVQVPLADVAASGE
ncbi:MAG: PVC-type heme-binding CxxCH protein [Planctomycetota bacterium]